MPVDADDEFVTTDAKDALAQDTKDAVAAEPEQPAGQADVYCCGNGPPACSVHRSVRRRGSWSLWSGGLSGVDFIP